MRIITGTARGVKLEAVAGDIVRPTTEMAKEGLFSAIQFDLDSRRVLDLFAGSGQLGLEALSRGAAFAVFVDELEKSVEVVKKNAQKAKLFQNCRIVRMDYTDFLKKNSETFHYIFVDPPYHLGIVEEVVKKIFKYGALAPDGVIVCEIDEACLDEEKINEAGGEIFKKYKYGKTYIHMVRAK